MKKPTLDVEHLVSPVGLATDIANKWNEWNSLRQKWLEQKKELRNYLYATDTTTTSNKALPWMNSTTTPKLTQIYDNLKANYTATLFPNSNWMKWEGENLDSARKDKVKVIQGYMQNKVRQSHFELEMDKLIDDFILYGNAFASVAYEANYYEVDGVLVTGYIGPRVTRISPNDIVFNPTASDFTKTPKIVRSLVGLGELRRDIVNGEEWKEEVFTRMLSNRSEINGGVSTEKSEGFIADGFSSIEHYYGSSYVELLTFYGDMYDTVSGTLKENRMITVVDRAYVIQDEPIPSWLGHDPIFHAGWRNRPDNLYAMGPLDNLVGLQYRIDHLENLKADVFDQIALPILKIRGDVEDFEYGPAARIYMGEEGDVAPMVPDATALNADLQIQLLENKMEELAGAPRNAMGIRTPGEKTAFEVQRLETAASRIFQHKSAQFEKEFVEPILNAMLEAARRQMDVVDTIRIIDDPTGVELFRQITRDDIIAKGTIRPIGARHFAERAQRVQNINQLMQFKQMPDVGVHLSGKKVAELLAYELGENDLFGDNVAVEEQKETQGRMQDAEADMMEEMQIAAEEGL